MSKCQSIVTSGDVCGKKALYGQLICGTHRNQLLNNGPNLTAVKELKYKHKKVLQGIIGKYARDILVIGASHYNIERKYNIDTIDAKARYEKANICLILNQREQVELTGIDPDAEPKERRRNRLELLRVAQLRQWNMWRVERERQIAQREAHIAEDDAAWALAQHLQVGIAPAGGLERFARDPQNIHTTTAVKQTKAIVERILKIAVPEGYRWNYTVCSKTPFDIGLVCKLTPEAAAQMTKFYTMRDSIYEMGDGIYGRVLDCVWQYVQTSDDKDALQRTLKVEMEDNIGMCAQGNISRIVNILAGYFDDIKINEPFSEILGRRLPLLIDIDDYVQRLDALIKLYDEVELPKDDWVMWAEPLFDDMTVEMKEGILIVH